MVARTEYANLNELKAFITMDAAVVDRDDMLTIALDAAHDALDADCGRRFYLDGAVSARVYETADRVVPERSGETLLIDDVGDVTGLILETGSGSSWSVVSSTWRLSPENAIVRARPVTGLRVVNGAWPADGVTQVRVTAKWGWPAVPPRVKEATLLQANRLYARRKSAQGVVGTADWGQIRVSRLDPDVFALVAQLSRGGFG